MNTEIHLVVTVAHHKELPLQWLKQSGICVVTAEALASGALSSQRCCTGVLFVITGVGPASASRAAELICDRLRPLFVLNLGTCGIIDRTVPTGRWLTPLRLYNANGNALKVDSRLPIEVSSRLMIESLLTVETPFKDRVPEQFRPYQAVDMEAFAQADVFSRRAVPFHCLKFGTDHAGPGHREQYFKNLPYFVRAVRGLLQRHLFFKEPSVSVVIPVFNRATMVRRAIDSVLQQTYKPSRIIVIDDGSTDSTPETLKHYGRRITTIRLPGNFGVSRARNVGVLMADTEWIAFLDSDDLWHREKLLSQIRYLRRFPFYQIIQSEEIWYRKGRRVNPCQHHRKPLGWAWEDSLKRCLISPSAVILRRDLFEKHGGFREDIPVCEDYDLWIRITRHSPVGLDPAQVVIKHGGHKDQLSKTYEAMDRYRIKTLLEMYLIEKDEYFRRLIARELITKTLILKKGAAKRNRLDDVKYYDRILSMLWAVEDT